jgi:hypothetical protein
MAPIRKEIEATKTLLLWFGTEIETIMPESYLGQDDYRILVVTKLSSLRDAVLASAQSPDVNKR